MIFGIVLLYRRALKWKVWARLLKTLSPGREASIVEFYERMQTVLASKGIVREPSQTPLEFAFAVGMPEVLGLTERYNKVRFGDKRLSQDETVEIESWLQDLAAADEGGKIA
jgi:hypothetical protein